MTIKRPLFQCRIRVFNSRSAPSNCRLADFDLRSSIFDLRSLCGLIGVLAITFAAGATPLLGQPAADTILYNGKILTVDRNFRVAQAVAVRGKEIAAVGTDAEINQLAGPSTVRIDLKGRTVTPGLVHTHVHLEAVGGYGRGLSPAVLKEYPLNFNLVKTKDDVLRQIKEVIAAFSLKPGQWIFFATNPRGVEHSRILLNELNASELDKASPSNPIVLAVGLPKTNVAMLNGKAIEILWRKYGDFIQTYGRYWIDASGKPSGIIEAPATKLLWSDEEFGLIPAAEDMAPLYSRILMENYAALGTTTISGGLNDSTVRAYQILDAKGEMPVRYGYGAMEAFGPDANMKNYKLGAGTDYVFITSMSARGVDGAGARMCVSMPKDAAVGNSGVMGISTVAEWWPRGQCHLDIEYNGGTRGARIKGNYLSVWFNQVAQEGLRSGNAHVSGDESHSRLISEWERIDAAKPGAVKGWAMDHCSMIKPADIPRAAKLGLMWSCSPLGEGERAGDIAVVFGEKIAHTYVSPIKTMLNAGINVSLEGQWPGVETLITRKDDKGNVWGPDQRVDRPTALRIATQNGANYMLKGGRLGSIEPGKLADLVVIDRDYLTVPEEEISETRSLLTMLGGKIIFLNTGFAGEQNLKPAGALIGTYEEIQAQRPPGGFGGGG